MGYFRARSPRYAKLPISSIGVKTPGYAKLRSLFPVTHLSAPSASGKLAKCGAHPDTNGLGKLKTVSDIESVDCLLCRPLSKGR